MQILTTIPSVSYWYADPEMLRQAEANLDRMVDIKQKAGKTVKVLDTISSFDDLLLAMSPAEKEILRITKEEYSATIGDSAFFGGKTAATHIVPKFYSSEFLPPLHMDPATSFYSPKLTSKASSTSVVPDTEALRNYYENIFILDKKIHEQLHFSDLFWSGGMLSAQLSRAERAAEITEEIRVHRAALSQSKFSNHRLLIEIRSLVHELYDLMRTSVREHKRLLRSGRKTILELKRKKLPQQTKDCIVFILFKIFDDFSGSEEEDKTDQPLMTGRNPSFTTTKLDYREQSRQNIRNTRRSHIRQPE